MTARSVRLVVAFFWLLALPLLSRAGNIDIPVMVDLNGKGLTTIGTVMATTTPKGGSNVRMEASFTMGSTYFPLLDCCHFHWLQVATGLDATATDNPTYKGKALKIPIIDPPNGGYSQLQADNLPYYLNSNSR
jgi:hypothetical protein